MRKTALTSDEVILGSVNLSLTGGLVAGDLIEAGDITNSLAGITVGLVGFVDFMVIIIRCYFYKSTVTTKKQAQ
jgi:hypothetical protein